MFVAVAVVAVADAAVVAALVFVAAYFDYLILLPFFSRPGQWHEW
jgi:hypothetical protein